MASLVPMTYCLKTVNNHQARSVSQTRDYYFEGIRPEVVKTCRQFSFAQTGPSRRCHQIGACLSAANIAPGRADRSFPFAARCLQRYESKNFPHSATKWPNKSLSTAGHGAPRNVSPARRRVRQCAHGGKSGRLRRGPQYHFCRSYCIVRRRSFYISAPRRSQAGLRQR